MAGSRHEGAARLACALGAVLLLAGTLVACTTPASGPPVLYPVDYTPQCNAPDPEDCVDVLVFGDSLGTNPGRYVKSRWQDLVATDLAGGDPEAVVRRYFDGSILGEGEVTQWDFARAGFSAAMWMDLPQYLPDPAGIGEVDVLVLALGVNDEGQNVPPARYGEALGQLVDLYPAQRCVIIGQWEWSAVHQQTAGLNFKYRAPLYRVEAEATATAKGCAYVDMTEMVTNGVAEAPESYDGLHMSDEGHAELGALVLDALAAP